MKCRYLLGVSACVLVLAFPVSVAAAAGRPGKAGKRSEQTEKRQTLRKYDRNMNGEIDGEERDALRKGFNAFRAMDANSNGMLEDSEVAALRAPKPRAGKPEKPGKPGKVGKKKRRQGQGTTQ